MILGIIGAMSEELEILLKDMKLETFEEKAKMKFHKGKLWGHDVVAVVCGIGKVNAAVCTQILASEYNVSAVINVGVAGGIGNMIDDLTSGVQDILGGNTLVNGVSTTVHTIKTAINGSNVFFPEIWKDSSFSRSHNVSFSFKSPYGSPKAIFEYVYVPFNSSNYQNN